MGILRACAVGLGILLAVGTPAVAGSETVRIETPRSVVLEGTLDVPAKDGVARNGVGVVLAPGAGYHRALPLLARTAEALAAAGFVVLRFDWAYFTAKGKPSSDLSTEREDLEAAIAHLRKLPGVTKVILAGKSMGSIVALERARRKSDDIAGLVLLTFPVVDVEADTSLGALGVPTLVVVGDQDPLAPLADVYRIAAQASPPPRVVVVPGNHGLGVEPKDEKQAAENIAVAAAAAVLWARRFAGV